jgi:hypothetical protein
MGLTPVSKNIPIINGWSKQFTKTREYSKFIAGMGTGGVCDSMHSPIPPAKRTAVSWGQFQRAVIKK